MKVAVLELTGTDDGVEDLRRATASYRADVIVPFGACVGALEVPQVQPRHIDSTDSGEYRLRVPREKDTAGSGGKPRDTLVDRSGSEWTGTRVNRQGRGGSDRLSRCTQDG
jgi:hypothetical protein